MILIEQINSHRYLFLNKLVEVNDLELILLIDEGRVDEDTEGNLNEVLEFAPSIKTNPIISNEKCKRYKITISDYLAYSVRNESFTSWDDDETFKGKLFRIYLKSKFLNYMEKATDVDHAKFLMDEAEYIHFGICCENQIIDIASANQPIIEELKILK